ncbi:MAG TPA: polysaccharide biosynthesis/export family protein [Terriglobales bacterium]|nr:polysaccharide biosynthesis/export family protein [Terriglobales bacterium]
MKLLAAFLPLALLAVALPAQQSAPLVPEPAAPIAANAVPSSYIIGINDVLAMTVYGAPELDDAQMRVDPDGTIHTPFGATPVHVGGLDLAGARQAIAAELVKDQLAVDPRVEVAVVDAQSHPIVISGLGVRQPGTIQAVQPIRLLDALNRAGGLSTNDGAIITILRPAPGGGSVQQTILASQVLSGASEAMNPWLRGGEQVRVLPGGNVYVAGAVNQPGPYPLSDTDPMTVRKLMAKAHGLATAAKPKQAQLVHHAGEPDQTVEPINLQAILDGKAHDPNLAANDLLVVPISGGKKALGVALSQSITALTLAAGELLGR